MWRLLRGIPVLIVLAVLCALAAATVNAQDNASPLESVDVFIDVQQNGDMLIQETIAYTFLRRSTFNGRYISLKFIDHIDQVSVLMDGVDLPVRTNRGEKRFHVNWEHGPVSPPETHTFVLRYRVRGGLHLGEEQDAVIWEAVPGNRGQGSYVDQGTVAVRFPPSVSGQIEGIEAMGGEVRVEQPDPRNVTFTLLERLPGEEKLAVRLFLPHGLLDTSPPNWSGESSWIFERTGLVNRFPTANWVRATDVLYWALRFSVFGLVALLLHASRSRNSRWPAADFPQVTGDVTTLPSDLPAPVVSVLGSRKVEPQTYLSILVDMLQKGNLTITGGYDQYDRDRELQSGVTIVRQSEPDLPWETIVFDALPVGEHPSSELMSILEERKNAIRTHLDNYLLSRGVFDQPPLQIMEDQGQGWVAQCGWFFAAVLLAIGVGLWVNLWLPWWAGAAVGIPSAVVFLGEAWDSPAGRCNPTPAGAFEMRRWFAFSRSLMNGRVSPSLDPDEPDPLLPYAVALDAAGQWVNDVDAIPPWFLPGGAREQTREDLYAAYRGFIGADSWDLAGGPKIKSVISRGGGGGG